MKKLLRLTAITGLIIFALKSQAQIDTLQYLKETFEAKKADYIGKPFSHLLSKMAQMQPQNFLAWPNMGNKNITREVLFMFSNQRNAITMSIKIPPPYKERILKCMKRKTVSFSRQMRKHFTEIKL